MPAPRSWTSSFQIHGKTPFCCLDSSGWGTSSHQPGNTRSFLRLQQYQLHLPHKDFKFSCAWSCHDPTLEVGHLFFLIQVTVSLYPSCWITWAMMRGVMFIVILSFESEGRKFTRLVFCISFGGGGWWVPAHIWRGALNSLWANEGGMTRWRIVSLKLRWVFVATQ